MQVPGEGNALRVRRHAIAARARREPVQTRRSGRRCSRARGNMPVPEIYGEMLLARQKCEWTFCSYDSSLGD
jgi:hypothetical protein